MNNINNFFKRFWLYRALSARVPFSVSAAFILFVASSQCGSLLVIVCQMIGLFGISFSWQ